MTALGWLGLAGCAVGFLQLIAFGLLAKFEDEVVPPRASEIVSNVKRIRREESV